MTTDKNNSAHSNDTPAHSPAKSDNPHQEPLENSPNGTDDPEIHDGQNGRNIRAMGSQDMDTKNGVLRLGDTDDSTMEVTEAGKESATASIAKTNTSTTSPTTTNPDDEAPDAAVNVPNAQQEAKKQAEADKENTAPAVSQEETEENIAETGTSIDHQPTY